MKKFAHTLKELRIEKNITQEKFAKDLGTSRSSIGMYETGEREPDFETTIRIADYFDVDVDFLVGRKPLKEQYEQGELWEKFDEDVSSVSKIKNESNLCQQIQNCFGKDAVQLLQIFTELNTTGKEKALENLYDLAELPKYTDEDMMYRAARSKEHTAPKVVKKSKERISALEKAPKVTKSDDL